MEGTEIHVHVTYAGQEKELRARASDQPKEGFVQVWLGGVMWRRVALNASTCVCMLEEGGHRETRGR